MAITTRTNEQIQKVGANSVDETRLEAMVDATLADSFPASDPPFWTLGREPHPPLSLTKNPPKTRQTPPATHEGKK